MIYFFLYILCTLYIKRDNLAMWHSSAPETAGYGLPINDIIGNATVSPVYRFSDPTMTNHKGIIQKTPLNAPFFAICGDFSGIFSAIERIALF